MSKNTIHIIIQARMGATRLPGKILMSFAGDFTFLEWIGERAKSSQEAGKVIVATTDSFKDDIVEEFCKKKGYDYFRGSESDVLGRYHGAAKQFGSEIIVRVMADNPLIDIKEMDRAIEILIQEHLDYVSTHPAGLPVGNGTEVFTRRAFERVFRGAKDPYEREHVTPYFYRHSELFTQKNISPLIPHPFASSVRLTLDTPEYANFLCALASGMGFSDPLQQPSTNEILSYLESHPELVMINKSVVQKTFPGLTP